MEDNRVRCMNCFMEVDDFKRHIVDFLSENPYTDHKFIAKRLKANSNDVLNHLLDIIVETCKKYNEEHSVPVNAKQICNTLYIRSEYIEMLIDQDRIEIKKADFDNLKEELKVLDKKGEDIVKLVTAQELMGALSEPKPKRTSIYDGAKMRSRILK